MLLSLSKLGDESIKRLEYFDLLTNLFYFKAIYDPKGTEFIVFSQCPFDSLQNCITDKTEFEALENHVHLIEHVTKEEFNKLAPIAKNLGQALLNALKFNYPNKSFVVYVTIDLHDSLIIRFHQKWEGEEPYYPADFNSSAILKIIMLEA
ncbi:MAG: hypothetical protein LBS74_11350 [Oscillospiraceae bacterium]|jgi:hypothetical protein|nr:hypothetical protein [Oscillospiraceae bacterium]